MTHYIMPAPCEGAGDDSEPTKLQNRRHLTPIWACPEISERPLALDYAETVHDIDCEDRGLLFPNAVRERCADPMLLLSFLPFDAIAPVRRGAEGRLRAWAI